MTVIDVESKGLCGYMALAHQLFGSVVRWPEVKQALVGQLISRVCDPDSRQAVLIEWGHLLDTDCSCDNAWRKCVIKHYYQKNITIHLDWPLIEVFATAFPGYQLNVYSHGSIRQIGSAPSSPSRLVGLYHIEGGPNSHFKIAKIRHGNVRFVKIDSIKSRPTQPNNR